MNNETKLTNTCIKCGVDLHNSPTFICQEHPKNCKGIHISEETLLEWANKEALEKATRKLSKAISRLDDAVKELSTERINFSKSINDLNK